MRRSTDGYRRLLGGLVLAALAGGAAGCGKGATAEEGEAASVPTIQAEVGTVTRRDLLETVTVRGALAAIPNEDVRISALVAGRVVAVTAAEGDAVRAGQVVAEIDARPLLDQKRQAEAALAQAKTSLETAKLNLERTLRLFERGIAAGKEVEDARNQEAGARAALDQAAAALDIAERQVDRAKVTSPISGQVVKRVVSVGEQVDGTAAEPLLEVANLDRVELAAHVAAEHLPAVRVGQKAVMAVEGDGRAIVGEVVAIAPAVDPITNAAIARIRFANPTGGLKLGMYGEARVTVGERKGVLTVPPSAVVRGDSGETSVYVVTEGEARRTAVQVGLETADAVELRSGVREGEAVLLSGVHGLGEKARLGKSS